MESVSSLKEAGEWLRTKALWLRGILLWATFKSVQATVAACFSFIIVAQAVVAGLLRLFGEPQSLLKVRAAQVASVNASLAADRHSRECAAKGGLKGPAAAFHVTAVAADPSTVKPVHVFVDPSKGHDSEAWKQIGPYMRKYGRHAIANSQLFNPEYIHFYVPGVGSIAYIIADLYNRVVVSAVGDPLAPYSQWPYLTDLFLKEFPQAYFYHASEKYAALLHNMGYFINDVGAETTLQVQSWAYTSRTRTVRAAARAARESGVRVRELKPEELTEEMRHKLQHDVSGDWLQQKAVADRELRVFVRNVDYSNIQLRDGIRIFVAEAYEPIDAPPAYIDPVLQGAALNAKPPKPPRASRSLKGQGSLSRADSVLTSASSCGSLASMNSLASTPSISRTPSVTFNLGGGGNGGGRNSSNNSPVGSGRSADTTAAAEASVAAAAAAGAAPVSRNVLRSTPFASLDAARAVQQQQQQQGGQQGQPQQQQPGAAETAAAGGGGGVRKQPELVGFVLLDPLWENGEEVGYVSSIVRMKRSAHQGTLKLLYEDIISRLRKEGKKELAFGFAPFFNVRDHRFARYIHWMRWTALYLFHCANNVYAFQNLAFSKIRYGAGVTEDGSKFRDPNVTMSHIYMANKHYAPGWSIVDLYVICMYVGFMDEVWDTWLKLTGIRKGGANLSGGSTHLGGSDLAHAPSAVPL